MKLLAFETATEACSVALWLDGQVLERHELAPRRHAELSLPWAEALLAEAGVARSALDAIAVGRGPGAFTGVRLAIALAQGIALALDRPVIPVSTLAALAMQAPPGEAIAAIDARMQEVYVGRYRVTTDGGVEPVGEERLIAPAQWEWRETADAAASLHGLGTGFAALDGALRERLGPTLGTVDAAALPRAADVARLAARHPERGLPPERVEPAYLRNDVALTLAEQQARRASPA